MQWKSFVNVKPQCNKKHLELQSVSNTHIFNVHSWFVEKSEFLTSSHYSVLTRNLGESRHLSPFVSDIALNSSHSSQNETSYSVLLSRLTLKDKQLDTLNRT